MSSDEPIFFPGQAEQGAPIAQQRSELTEVSAQLQATSKQLLAASQQLLSGIPLGLTAGDDEALAELTEATARSVHRGAAGCAELATQIDAQVAQVEQW